MCERSPSVRALRTAAIGLAACAAYEALKQALFPHISAWQSHVTTILFFGAGVFFLSRLIIRREQGFVAAIREREMFADDIIQNLPVVLCMFDAEGHILRWNKQLESKLGYSSGEISKAAILDTVGEEDRERMRQLLRAAFSGNPVETETSLLHRNGTKVAHYLTGAPVTFRGQPCILSVAVDISHRKQIEEALQRAEQKYRSIFEEAITGIFQCTPGGRFLTMNPSMATMFGFESPEQAIEQIKDVSVLYHDPAKRQELRTRLERDGKLRHIENEFSRLDGTELWLSVNLRCVYGDDGTPAYYEGTAEDITAQKLLERQLQQAQKMEAVGRLAGGVAHDFNNLLGVITGYSELLKLQSELDGAARHQIEQIHMAGKRAAALTQQLLAFSRKQIVQPQIVNLNAVVSRLSGMVRRLIGEDIELKVHFLCRDAYVNVDAGQIDQVILNLVVNARDAMPNGGELIVETDICELDESYVMRHQAVRPGPYVRLAVTDTGCGMDQKIMSHLFEPFFTTKEMGKGTGLGLSTVYGIIKQSEGYIWAYSEPGRGSCFKVYLPLKGAEAERPAAPPRIGSIHGVENVLVVEDDKELRSLVMGFLKGLGYAVREAENGETAWELVTNTSTPVEVLITDIVMPKMNGRDLADRVTSRFPDAKILYTSGYTHDGLVQLRALQTGEAFLPKPFALTELGKELRAVIDIEKKPPC